MPPVGDGSQGGQMGSGGDGERRGSDRRPGSSLNEQIAVVLIRLQEDMQNVFQRLHTLETLTASRVKLTWISKLISLFLSVNFFPYCRSFSGSWESFFHRYAKTEVISF